MVVGAAAGGGGRSRSRGRVGSSRATRTRGLGHSSQDAQRASLLRAPLSFPGRTRRSNRGAPLSFVGVEWCGVLGGKGLVVGQSTNKTKARGKCTLTLRRPPPPRRSSQPTRRRRRRRRSNTHPRPTSKAKCARRHSFTLAGSMLTTLLFLSAPPPTSDRPPVK